MYPQEAGVTVTGHRGEQGEVSGRRMDTPPGSEDAQVGTASGTSFPVSQADVGTRTKAVDPLAIHHVGVAVNNIDEAMRFYGEKLGLDLIDRRELPDRALKVAFVQAANTLIELLEPTNPQSTLARFLDRRGPGLHHLCFGTPDIDAYLRDLRDKGVDLIDETPRPGALGDVAFIQPEAAYGVLEELIQLAETVKPRTGER